jgi:WD40 repeat protein
MPYSALFHACQSSRKNSELSFGPQIQAEARDGFLRDCLGNYSFRKRQNVIGPNVKPPEPRVIVPGLVLPVLNSSAPSQLRLAWFATIAVLLLAQNLSAEQSDDIRLMIKLGHSSSGVSCVTFSPDGRYVLTGSWDSSAVLWQRATGREIRVFVTDGQVESVRFSPDSKFILAGVEHKGALLWEVETGKEIRRFGDDKSSSTKACFSPDGRYVCTPGNPVRIWDATTGDLFRTIKLRDKEDHADVIEFSLDGEFVIGSAQSNTFVWRVSDGRLFRQLPGTSVGSLETRERVAVSRDGAVVTGGEDNHPICAWDIRTGKLLLKIPGSNLASASFSSDGAQLLIGELDWDSVRFHLSLFDVRTGTRIREYPNIHASDFEISPDNLSILATDGDYRGTHIWDLVTGEEVRQFASRQSLLTGAVFLPPDKVVISRGDGTLGIWDLSAGREVRNFQIAHDTVESLMLSPDGTQVLTICAIPGRSHHSFEPIAGLGELSSWDLATGRKIHKFESQGLLLNTAAFSPDGRRVAAGGAGDSAWIWDAGTGQLIRKISMRKKSDTETIVGIAFSPDSRFLVTGTDEGVETVLDAESGRQIKVLKNADKQWTQVRLGGFTPNPVAFSADGRYVIAGCTEGVVRMWQADTGKQVATFAHDEIVSSLAVSVDSKFLITAGEQEVLLWDLATGSRVFRFAAPPGGFCGATFGFKDLLLLMPHCDGSVSISDPHTGSEIVNLVSLANGEWVVTDSEGRYDASAPDGSPDLYWMVGNEPIDLAQLKQRFYTPSLLPRLIRHEALPKLPAGIRTVQLPPEVLASAPLADSTKMHVELKNRGGGIGPVVVKVNGKEIQPGPVIPTLFLREPSGSFDVDLSQAALASDGHNLISVVAYDRRQLLSSEVVEVTWQTNAEEQNKPLTLYGIIVGVSDYANPSLHLQYPAKDAEDIALAIRLGADRLFGGEHVVLTVLTSGSTLSARQPTKANLTEAFTRVAQKAKPRDILLVFLAGHGVTRATESDRYYFLTAEANSVNLDALQDDALRNASTFSSSELREWCLRIKALKEVIILDTCAAGAATQELLKLAKPRQLSADQVRAMELLKDATGSHVLMGSAADAVSYEASRYGQGLLTFALLEGFRGAALDDGQVDVSRLFHYAEVQVQRLAQGVGGIQKPLVSSPAGRSFPIGIMTAEDCSRVPLAQAKPELLRPQCHDENDLDSLRLADSVRGQLRRLSQSTERGTESLKEPPFVYLDEISEDLAGAISPRVQYKIENETVHARLTLVRDGQRIGSESPNFTLRLRDSSQLAEQIVNSLMEQLKLYHADAY